MMRRVVVVHRWLIAEGPRRDEADEKDEHESAEKVGVPFGDWGRAFAAVSFLSAVSPVVIDVDRDLA